MAGIDLSSAVDAPVGTIVHDLTSASRGWLTGPTSGFLDDPNTAQEEQRGGCEKEVFCFHKEVILLLRIDRTFRFCSVNATGMGSSRIGSGTKATGSGTNQAGSDLPEACLQF